MSENLDYQVYPFEGEDFDDITHHSHGGYIYKAASDHLVRFGEDQPYTALQSENYVNVFDNARPVDSAYYPTINQQNMTLHRYTACPDFLGQPGLGNEKVEYDRLTCSDPTLLTMPSVSKPDKLWQLMPQQFEPGSRNTTPTTSLGADQGGSPPDSNQNFDLIDQKEPRNIDASALPNRARDLDFDDEEAFQEECTAIRGPRRYAKNRGQRDGQQIPAGFSTCDYPDCGSVFKSRASLARHIRSKHLSQHVFRARCTIGDCKSKRSAEQPSRVHHNILIHQRKKHPEYVHLPRKERYHFTETSKAPPA
ncbi:hypothetical protein TWF718_003417 [Orbilia javanica]|uniref:C2H2-type domain-containing protein n=1 Tax=Orbilia javanica TaxID=47235 RepID=A0AAN8ML77_9PEZI